MNDDSPQQSPKEPDEPYPFQFVVPGSQIVYELKSIGELRTALGHTIFFCPVFSAKGWSDHKTYIASLRLKHFDKERREIGRCLLDRDEAIVWAQFLHTLRCGPSRFKMIRFEYVTRHGIRWVWNPGIAWQLHVASKQSAILRSGFSGKLLTIFDEFESLCHDFG